MTISFRPPEWTDKTWLAWCAILNLSPAELLMLKQRLTETFGPDDNDLEGGAGVREPRRPGPPRPYASGIALELPEGDISSGLNATP